MTREPIHHGFDVLMDQSKLIVSCGSGGVGKTTTSAAIALRAAEGGRTALVLTIDPAKRLATCLGLETLGGKPSRIKNGGQPGEMWGMMLDAESTFDALIDRLSPDQETAETIKGSRLYGIFAGSLHGTNEYIALESLYDVYSSGRFDLIVLDTPPLTNALTFFKVPNRASWMFDERVMRWFSPQPTSRGLRDLVRPGAVVMRLLKYLAGPTLVNDIGDFFEALNVIGDELKRRGDEVGKILRREDTRYIVVTGAADRRIEEALYLDDQLRDLDQAAELFIINRSHHAFADDGVVVGAEEALAELLGDPAQASRGIDAVLETYRHLSRSGARHLGHLQKLAERVGSENVCAISDLPHDVASIDQLRKIGELIVR